MKDEPKKDCRWYKLCEMGRTFHNSEYNCDTCEQYEKEDGSS